MHLEFQMHCYKNHGIKHSKKPFYRMIYKSHTRPSMTDCLKCSRGQGSFSVDLVEFLLVVFFV
jgi:hypothetical protein